MVPFCTFKLEHSSGNFLPLIPFKLKSSNIAINSFSLFPSIPFMWIFCTVEQFKAKLCLNIIFFSKFSVFSSYHPLKSKILKPLKAAFQYLCLLIPCGISSSGDNLEPSYAQKCGFDIWTLEKGCMCVWGGGISQNVSLVEVRASKSICTPKIRNPIFQKIL